MEIAQHGDYSSPENTPISSSGNRGNESSHLPPLLWSPRQTPRLISTSRSRDRGSSARGPRPGEDMLLEENLVEPLDFDDDDRGRRGSMCKRRRTTVMSLEEQKETMEGKEDDSGVSLKLNRKSQSAMDEVSLFNHHEAQLGMITCPKKSCDCLAICREWGARSAIAKYLTWFQKREKHEQNSIVFEWVKYTSFLKPTVEQKKGKKNTQLFCLPFIDDGTEVVDDTVRTHLNCLRGMQVLLGIGDTRYRNIKRAAQVTSVLPPHKSAGKKACNATENNESKSDTLKAHSHFEYADGLF